MDATLYLAFDDQPRFKVVENIPPGDYRPRISIGDPGMRLKVLVRSPGRKRQGDPHVEGSSVMSSMWADRAFTDAVVVCGQKRISVHRCVLVAVSPFFAAAFKGSLREASQASITIGEATEDVVEGFLQYLYTQTIPTGITYADLLPLAHRYECKSLLDLCAAEVVETLGEHNVAKYVAMLQPFEDDPTLGKYWAKAAERICSDAGLAKAMMRGYRARVSE